MKTDDFDYRLPPELIAQEPSTERDKARLLLLDRKTGETKHSFIKELPHFLNPGDLVILNNTRVIPARLKGKREETGANLEILLLNPLSEDTWETLVRPGKKALPGINILLSKNLKAKVLEKTAGGGRAIKFYGEKSVKEALFSLGQVPLPPYIKKKLDDEERYQTVYSKIEGSVAAPTAGLHFTKDIMDALSKKDIKQAFITLHIGLGTFRPVKEEYIVDHEMHEEHYFVPQDTIDEIRKTKARGNKIIAVGTTVCRTLESIACQLNNVEKSELSGSTDLFIYPGYNFKVVDALLTNFHLPRSTLLMLVSAFSQKEFILKAYNEAIAKKYRFYSFGDAMLLL